MRPVLHTLLRQLSGLHFFFYALLVAGLGYASELHVLPLVDAGEKRDKLLYFLLPAIFEISYLLTIIGTWLLSQVANYKPTDTAPPTRLSLIINNVPIVVGCLALISPDFLTLANIIGLGALILLQMAWRWLPRTWFFVGLECLVAAAVAWFVIKAQGLSVPKNDHHWAFYLGPLLAYREDGILLWDTPSQYGFLNILFISIIATVLSINAFLALNLGLLFLVVLSFALAICVFAKQMKYSPLVSVVFAAVIIFFYPGWFELLLGPMSYPAGTAIRFLPSLLALLALDRASATGSKRFTLLAALLAASSFLWSAESLAYTIAPLFAFIVIKAVSERDIEFFGKPPFQVLVLSTIFAGLFLFAYSNVLDTPIDPLSLFDYAISYSEDRYTIPIELNSWTFFFIFALGMCYFFARSGVTLGKGKNLRGVLFFGFAYCVATYFIARSHYNNILNLIPWLIIAICLSSPLPKAVWLASFHRVGVFVVCCLLVSHAFLASRPETRARVVQRFSGPLSGILERPYYKSVPREVEAYIKERLPDAGVTLVQDKTIFNPLTGVKSNGFYLPVVPLEHLYVLPRAPVHKYLSRMSDRKPQSFVVAPPADVGVAKMTIESGGYFTVVEVEDLSGWKIFEVKRTERLR